MNQIHISQNIAPAESSFTKNHKALPYFSIIISSRYSTQSQSIYYSCTIRKKISLHLSPPKSTASPPYFAYANLSTNHPPPLSRSRCARNYPASLILYPLD